MDPFLKSSWSALYRPIRDCGALRDNNARADGFSELRRTLRSLAKLHPGGIPGSELNLALDDSGVRPYLQGIASAAVRKLLTWKDDETFPSGSVGEIRDALKDARKEAKDAWVGRFEKLGKPGSGFHAKDDLTFVVVTEGDCPYLPELVARSAFAPLHESVESKRAMAFEVGEYVSNGPFVLAGRGAKPREGKESERVSSVVELRRNPKYAGPNRAKVDRILCKTDVSPQQPGIEELRQYEAGKLQWINATWPEWPSKKQREAMEKSKGFTARDTPRVLYLRFRCDREPFNDKNARKAFALAVDRAAAAGSLWPKARPALRLVPDGIEGRVEGVSCPQANAAAAKAAFEAVGFADDAWIELSHGEAPGLYEVATSLIADWKKAFGLEAGRLVQSDKDIRSVVRAGKFYVMLSDLRGAVNDPGAYLEPLHGDDPDSGLGWRDAAYDALIDAVRDPQTALADPAAWLQTVGDPGLKAALDAAKASRDGRLRLRREALAAAERRILSEYVVVPLVFPREASLLKDAKGLGSEAARRNPGFVGSLASVER